MPISLIITTYNWPQALNLTLASVASQTVLPAEVLVADDGSTDETAAVVTHWQSLLGCPVKHIWQQDEGYRLARSRNRAIAACTGDYIVLVDGDMLLHPRFIEDHRSCARKDCYVQGARPSLSARDTAERLRTGDPRVHPFTAGIDRRPYAIRSTMLSRLASKARLSISGIQGCNQSFWREHAIRVNGFDERFDGWGPEDKEFAARLMHVGIKRYYVRHRAIAVHLHHPSRMPRGNNPLDELLLETLRTRKQRCVDGLDLHTAPVPYGSADSVRRP